MHCVVWCKRIWTIILILLVIPIFEPLLLFLCLSLSVSLSVCLSLPPPDDGALRIWKNFADQRNPEMVTAWQGLSDMLPTTRGQTSSTHSKDPRFLFTPLFFFLSSPSPPYTLTHPHCNPRPTCCCTVIAVAPAWFHPLHRLVLNTLVLLRLQAGTLHQYPKV